MLKVGDQLPEFEAVNQDGEKVKSTDFPGSKLVVFFYPKASTPGCKAEACNLSNNFEFLKKQGFKVVGISADSVKRQKAFHKNYNFEFDLIADESKEIIKKFGVWKPKKFIGKEFLGIVRTTFIFDEKGICTEVIEKVNTKDHAAQILKD